MSAAPGPTPLRAMRLLVRGVLIELVRRKDLYVLLMLMGLWVLGVISVSVVGIENAATAAFLLNMGLMLAHLAAHTLTLLLAVRQLPDEIENRTLHPLLARPVDRSTVLLGKWAACTLCGLICAGLFFPLAWLPAPKTGALSAVMMMQVLALEAVSLGLLAALALLLSLVVPKGVNIVLMALLVLLGSRFTGLVEAQAAGEALGGAVTWLLAYLPDFARLNLITRYTDGIAPLGAGMFLGLVLHGLLLTWLALGVGHLVFRRRAI